jgi:predicted deacylase
MIQVRAGADAGTQIPVTTIRGAGPGPILALIAGNHGYEYPPILALQKLRTLIDPAKLKGAIIMVHVANMPSFLGRTVYF